MGYKALSEIDHDGTIYQAGDDLPEMDEKQTQALVDAGVVQESGSYNQKEESPEDPNKGTQEIDQELKKMNRNELLELAKSEGVEVAETSTRAELVEAITTHRNKQPV